MKKAEEKDTQKNVDGSLKAFEDELRDLYMNYREQADRCELKIEEHKKEHEQVFYFKPDTILLQEPEKQRQFR